MQVGETGACRHTEASLGNANLDDGCHYRLPAENFDHCIMHCNRDPNCQAIEINDAGTHCELWTCLPQVSSSSTQYGCYWKTTRNYSFFS